MQSPPDGRQEPAAGSLRAGAAEDPSLWSPLRLKLFRAIWLANLTSFIGTWMHEVAAAWLMTSLAPTPIMVAAVQAAATLPMFALVLPAGALADVADRRRLLIAAELWMLAAAAALATLAFLERVTPSMLLLLTGLLAVGGAMAAPAWQAVLPEVVTRKDLAGAVALGSLSINVARALGPALGGFLVAAAGPAPVFLLNALSFVAVVSVLGRWRRNVEPSDLPAEKFFGALRAGLRYVRFAPRMHAVLVRTAAFTFAGSAVWALLPLKARGELGLDAAGYGALLGAFGAGAVVSATQLPRLRRRFEADTVVLMASLVFAAAVFALGLASDPAWAYAAMALAGMAWMILLSSFHVTAQTVLPAWVRARALAAYLLVFFGSLALGSLAWGALAGVLGVRRTLWIAAVAAAASVLWRVRFRLRGGEDLDLAPSRHWPAPGVETQVEDDRGPVLVTVEYRVDAASMGEFRLAMERLRRARQRDGAYYWDLFVDTSDPGRCLEVFLADSWLEHLRHHERVTEQDRKSELDAQRFVEGGRPVSVRHFVSIRGPGSPFGSHGP